jgi:hypothetical protein
MNRWEITNPAADHKALTRKFLIATPRLEFLLSPSKQSPLTFSNRDYIALFQFFLLCPASLRLPAAAGILPGLLTYGRASRTAGIPAGAFAVSRFTTHPPVMAPATRLSRFTSHGLSNLRFRD